MLTENHDMITGSHAWIIPVFLLLAAAFFAGAFAWPVLRLRVRHGTWGIVFHREADPVQALVGRAFGLLFVGYLAWALVVALGAASGAPSGPVKVAPGMATGTTLPAVLGLWERPAWLAAAGLALMALGVVGVALAQAHLGASLRIGIDDRPTELVTGGIYRFSRNPIFAAMLVFLLGVTWVTPSPWTVALGLGTWFVVALQVRLEEAHLERQHGATYRAYCRRVPRYGRLRGPQRPRQARMSASG